MVFFYINFFYINLLTSSSSLLCRVLWDAAAFLAYVGADQVNCESGTEDQFGINRAQVGFIYSMCVEM